MKTSILILISLLISSAVIFANDEILTERINEVIKEFSSVKLGDTRSDLKKYFTTEGGISIASQRTYVSRRCPYIKFDVTFNVINIQKESPKDTIGKISKPYLEYSISD